MNNNNISKTTTETTTTSTTIPTTKPTSKVCTFPDASSFTVQTILGEAEGYTHIVYQDEDLTQKLWVPSNFISDCSL